MATNFNVGKVALNPRGLWFDTETYTKFDRVKNANQSVYIAKKDVPAGTLLTNTEYWYEDSNFDDLAANIQQVLMILNKLQQIRVLYYKQKQMY